MVRAHKAVLEADLGLVEQARASAEWGLACSQEVGDEVFTTLNLAALGHVEFALGNLDGAAHYLRALPARILAAGHRQPGLYDFWPDTIETLIALGEVEQARAHLDEYEELARLASRRAVACAARCRGLLAAAEGDLAAAFDALAGALAEIEAAYLSARAGPHAALPGHGAPAGAAEEGCPGGARASAGDLRGAGRAAVGRQGARRAQAHQRPPASLGGADRDRAAGCQPGSSGSIEQGDRRRAVHGRAAPSRCTSRASTPSSACRRAGLMGRLATPQGRSAKPVDEAVQP